MNREKLQDIFIFAIVGTFLGAIVAGFFVSQFQFPINPYFGGIVGLIGGVVFAFAKETSDS